MTYYRVSHLGDTVLTNLVDLNYSAGKRALLDPLSASSGQARFRRITSNAAALDAVLPGDYVEIDYSLNGTTWTNFIITLVSDITTTYGNPSPGDVYNDDYTTIQFEGTLALWGRANGQTVFPQGPLSNQLSYLFGGFSLGVGGDITTFNDPIFAQREWTSSPNEWLQLVCQSLNGRINDYTSDFEVEFASAYEFTPATYNFTDSTPSSTVMTCREIEFDSLADNYYNQVLVSIGPDLWPAVKTAAGATEPYRTLQIETLYYYAVDAASFAEYMLDLFKAPAQEISSVTCTGEAQHTDRLPLIAKTCIGKKFSIVFRGTTKYGICEGFDMVASPGTSTYKFYFSTDAQDVGWFILDDSNNGVLDENRLAF